VRSLTPRSGRNPTHPAIKPPIRILSLSTVVVIKLIPRVQVQA